MIIASVARYLMTPIPAVENMTGDELIAYHGVAMELLEAERPKG